MSLVYTLSKFQVFFDSHFHQKLDCHKVVFWQTRLQEVVRILVKCRLNHLRKKYGVLNNTSSAGKKCLVELTSKEHEESALMQFPKLCLNLWSLRWFKPNHNLGNNFRHEGWWILYIKSVVRWPSWSKVFLNFLKDFALRNWHQFIEIFRRTLGFYFIKSLKTSKASMETYWLNSQFVINFRSRSSFDCVCNCKSSIILNHSDFVWKALVVWLIMSYIT